MNTPSPIVSGGGWKNTRAENIKVKAWVTLFLAILLGSIAIVGSDSFWLYACIPAGISLFLSILFFFREKPHSIPFPQDRLDTDPRKL